MLYLADTGETKTLMAGAEDGIWRCSSTGTGPDEKAGRANDFPDDMVLRDWETVWMCFLSVKCYTTVPKGARVREVPSEEAPETAFLGSGPVTRPVHASPTSGLC